MISLFQFVKNAFLIQSLSHVQLFATPQTTECQASHSSLSPRVSSVFISIQSVMLSTHLILCFSPSPLALSLSQHQGLFQWVSSLHQVAKVLQLQHQSLQWISGLISFRIDWFDLLADHRTLKGSPAPPLESISSAISLLYCPTLTSIHDYWKNCSFDCTGLCQQSNVSAF